MTQVAPPAIDSPLRTPNYERDSNPMDRNTTPASSGVAHQSDGFLPQAAAPSQPKTDTVNNIASQKSRNAKADAQPPSSTTAGDNAHSNNNSNMPGFFPGTPETQSPHTTMGNVNDPFGVNQAKVDATTSPHAIIETASTEHPNSSSVSDAQTHPAGRVGDVGAPGTQHETNAAHQSDTHPHGSTAATSFTGPARAPGDTSGPNLNKHESGESHKQHESNDVPAHKKSKEPSRFDGNSTNYHPSELHPMTSNRPNPTVEANHTANAAPKEHSTSPRGHKEHGAEKFIHLVEGEIKVIRGKIGHNEKMVEDGRKLMGKE